jgi:hypothetical protein
VSCLIIENLVLRFIGHFCSVLLNSRTPYMSSAVRELHRSSLSDFLSEIIFYDFSAIILNFISHKSYTVLKLSLRPPFRDRLLVY